MKIARLDLIEPEQAEDKTFKLNEGETLRLGRDSGCDVVLANALVSSVHCSIRIDGNSVLLEDLGSSNGTSVDGREVDIVRLKAGSSAMIAGVVELRVGVISDDARIGRPSGVVGNSHTVHVGQRVFIESGRQGRSDGDTGNSSSQTIPFDLFHRSVISVADLAEEDVLVQECRYLCLGGGIGSFVFADHLRVFGVASNHIKVIGDNPVPYGNYQRYCQNSQIPPHERLRSNSLSAPDNVWGFPGYASREAWRGLRKGRLGEVGHIFTVFNEPALAISYTPRAQDVFDSMDREAARINWNDMFVRGRIRAMRKTDDGRFAVLFRRAGTSGPSYGVMVARYVHLATGYPAVRFLDDLQSLKAQSPALGERVVNAYDPHDHVYADMARSGRPVVVAVRGRGIVASRILQRLSELRRRNPHIKVVHLMRSRKAYGTGSRFERTKRPVFNDVDLQPFNWPKACWGGSLRKRIEDMSEAERAQAYAVLGGTTTAERDDWTALVEDGLREKWYEKVYGEVEGIEAASSSGDKLRFHVLAQGEINERRSFDCDYAVDCTGLIADMAKSPFLRDLLSTYNLPRNNGALPGKPPNLTGFVVSNAFEVEGMQNSGGRVFASGQLVGGGPYAAVDSFLGLQYCALRSIDALAATKRSGVQHLSPLASFKQWRRWCKGVAP